MVETIQSKNTSIKSKRNWQLKLVLLKSRDIFNKCWTIGSNGWKLRLGWRKRLQSNPTYESKNHSIRPTTRAKRQKNKRSSCEIMTIHQITREGRHEKQKKLRWNGTNLTLEVKQYLCAHRICPLKKIYLNASNW